MIASSVQIQQKLFVSPCLRREKLVSRKFPLDPENCSYTEEFESKNSIVHKLVQAPLGTTEKVHTPAVLCPILKVNKYNYPRSAAYQPSQFGYESRIINMAPLIKHSGSGAASWQRLQLTDPPCTKLRMRVDFDLNYGPRYRIITTTLKKDDGITLGDMFHRIVDGAQNIFAPDRDGKLQTTKTGKLTAQAPKTVRALGRRTKVWLNGNIVGEGKLLRMVVYADFEGLAFPREEGWIEITGKAFERAVDGEDSAEDDAEEEITGASYGEEEDD